jgi:hypothetical protein
LIDTRTIQNICGNKMTTEYIWEEIDAFRSAYEFEKFVRWLEKKVRR